MSILKKVLFVVAFVVLTLAVPGVILLLFVNATEQFAAYVMTYVGIIFAIFGYIIISIRSMSKELSDAVEEMKKQNAAIAYKLLGYTDANNVNTEASQEAPSVNTPEVKEDTSTVNLNPAEPLVFDKPSSEDVREEPKAKADDNFDDFE